MKNKIKIKEKKVTEKENENLGGEMLKKISSRFENVSTNFLENTIVKKISKNISNITDKKQSLNLNPFVYFSAGEALIDKDRDFNIDLRQIQSFFKPIDNLFGDYEVRKKFDLHSMLYIKSYFKKVEEKKIWQNQDIPNLEIENKERKTFKLFLRDDNSLKIVDNISKEDALLIFILLYDKSRLDLFIECFVTDAKELRSNVKNTLFKSIDDRISADVNIIQVFALDPEKLIQCIDLDASRQKHYKMVIQRNENIKIKIVEEFITKLTEYNFKNDKPLDIYDFNSIDDLLTKINIAPDEKNKEDFQNLVKVFQKRKYKLKSFEGYKYFRVRIGYEESRYVLFLHPYDSESNGPIRFPPQE